MFRGLANFAAKNGTARSVVIATRTAAALLGMVFSMAPAAAAGVQPDSTGCGTCSCGMRGIGSCNQCSGYITSTTWTCSTICGTICNCRDCWADPDMTKWLGHCVSLSDCA